MRSGSAFARFSSLALPLRLFALLSVFTLILIASHMTSSFTEGPVLCLFRKISGLPCPFCGTTRSIGSLAQGAISSAWSYNPLGIPIALSGVLIFILPNRFSALTNKVAHMWWRLSSSRQAVFAGAVIAIFWLFNLPRMI